MRQYRGKSKYTGKWIKGSLVTGEYTSHIVTGFMHSSLEGITRVQSFEVIHETVGQSTGLKDKNGVEIFEGDIVKLNVLIEPVRHKGTYWVDKNFLVKYEGQTFKPDRLSDCEIVGTIHDNPELMEESK